MAPRIRSIKPEIWNSRDFIALSPIGQLAFIALISLADDEGRLECDAAHLRATCLREARVSTLRAQLARAEAHGMLTQYTVAQKPYIQITNWGSHQRVDKPKPSSLPAPPSRIVANDRDAFPTSRDASRPRARPRIGSDRIGEEGITPPVAPPIGSGPAGRAAEVLPNRTEDPDVSAYAARWMQHAARAPSPDDIAFLRRIPYECDRLSRETVLAALDDVAEKHVGRGKPMPRATYLAGKLADLQAAAVDAGHITRRRSTNGTFSRPADALAAVPLARPASRDPDDDDG